MSDEAPPSFADFRAWVDRQMAHKAKVEAIMREMEETRYSTKALMTVLIAVVVSHQVTKHWPRYAEIGVATFSLAIIVLTIMEIVRLRRNARRFDQAMKEWRTS